MKTSAAASEIRRRDRRGAAVDDCFDDHPKVLAVLDEDDRAVAAAAIALWTLCLSWVSRNRGKAKVAHVPADLPERLLPRSGTAGADSLVKAGLWHPFDAGWTFVESDELFRWGPVDGHRSPIPTQVRLRVYARDGYRCVDCGATDDLTLDHIWPWSRGGEDTEENLRTCCRSCNSRKGANV